MKKRYNYRAYPHGEQRRQLGRLFGCVRFIFNATIAAAREDHKHGRGYAGATAYQKRVLTDGKQANPWLREVSGVPLVQAVRDADTAYRNFFNSVTGKRKGRRVGSPRFKSRKDRTQKARFSSAASAGGLRTHPIPGTKWGRVFLPKIGWVKFVWSRDLPSQPSSVTVTHHADDTYELSFVVDTEVGNTPPPTREAAVDLGLNDFAAVVYSDGTREKIATPKHFRLAQRKLAKAQRALSRTRKGSSNRRKAAARVARVHATIRHRRSDFTHKLSTRLARENQTVAVESLNIAGMARTRLAKSVHDAGWGQFLNQLADKTAVVAVDRWHPTTRTCSLCGVVGDKKPLHIREWTCSSCGTLLDRDYNAAVNIMIAAGLAETLNACGGSVRLRLAEADPTKQEPTERILAHAKAA